MLLVQVTQTSVCQYGDEIIHILIQDCPDNNLSNDMLYRL